MCNRGLTIFILTQMTDRSQTSTCFSVNVYAGCYKKYSHCQQLVFFAEPLSVMFLYNVFVFEHFQMTRMRELVFLSPSSEKETYSSQVGLQTSTKMKTISTARLTLVSCRPLWELNRSGTSTNR